MKCDAATTKTLRCGPGSSPNLEYATNMFYVNEMLEYYD